MRRETADANDQVLVSPRMLDGILQHSLVGHRYLYLQAAQTQVGLYQVSYGLSPPI